MIVLGTAVVEKYLSDRAGYKGIKTARLQYEVWLNIAARAQWRNPQDVTSSHPKASILKNGRVVPIRTPHRPSHSAIARSLAQQTANAQLAIINAKSGDGTGTT